jgi:hypothetical protein
MLCALTVRRLKAGAFEDFRKAWQMDSQPPGWVSSYTVRNVEDENEVVSFGFFDGSLEDLRGSQQQFDYAGQRANVDEFVEASGTDGIFEVVIEQRG